MDAFLKLMPKVSTSAPIPQQGMRLWTFIILFHVPLLLCSCLQTATESVSDLPIVVITFDDAHRSVYEKGFRLMRATDSTWNATHFFPNTTLGIEDHLDLATVQAMEDSGWENGGHGVGHENMASIPLDSVRQQINAVDSFFRVNGMRLTSWAYAYGNYNDSVQELIKAKCKNIRTSHDMDYLGQVDRTHLGYFAVKKEHSLQDLINRVEEARNNGSSLVIIGFHVILDPTEPETPDYFTRTAIFQGFLNYLKRREYPVMSMREAMERLDP